MGALLYFQWSQGSKEKSSGFLWDPCHPGSCRLTELKFALNGMCSPTSSSGRIIGDPRSCYNVFLDSFLLFIYMLPKDSLEALHTWCRMNNWIVIQKMVGGKRTSLLLGNSMILMVRWQCKCQWQNHKTDSWVNIKMKFHFKKEAPTIPLLSEQVHSTYYPSFSLLHSK